LQTRRTDSTDTAVDATAKNVLVQSGTDSIAKAEYAEENNQHSPCDDGQTGDGSTWPCADDSVCRGQPLDGHGRGMCREGASGGHRGRKIWIGLLPITIQALTESWGIKYTEIFVEVNITPNKKLTYRKIEEPGRLGCWTLAGLCAANGGVQRK